MTSDFENQDFKKPTENYIAANQDFQALQDLVRNCKETCEKLELRLANAELKRENKNTHTGNKKTNLPVSINAFIVFRRIGLVDMADENQHGAYNRVYTSLPPSFRSLLPPLVPSAPAYTEIWNDTTHSNPLAWSFAYFFHLLSHYSIGF